MSKKKLADTIRLQCRAAKSFADRIAAHAKRRHISIADWMREQARFGLEREDEGVIEAAAKHSEPACYLAGRNSSGGVKIECTSMEPFTEGFYCSGCKQFICAAHDINLLLPYGEHKSEDHLDDSEEV